MNSDLLAERYRHVGMFAKNSPFLWGVIFFVIGMLSFLSAFKNARDDSKPYATLTQELKRFFLSLFARLLGAKHIVRNGTQKNYFFQTLFSVAAMAFGLFMIFQFLTE